MPRLLEELGYLVARRLCGSTCRLHPCWLGHHQVSWRRRRARSKCRPRTADPWGSRRLVSAPPALVVHPKVGTFWCVQCTWPATRSFTVVARCPRGSPFDSGKAVVEATSSHIDCFGHQFVVLVHDIRCKLPDWQPHSFSSQWFRQAKSLQAAPLPIPS